MHYVFLIFFFPVFLTANTLKQERFVKFETGASFIFLQVDKINATFSIISEENSMVKSDGSYCYISDSIYDKYNDENSIHPPKIPDKYCKNTPPYENISKVLQTVMIDRMVYPHSEVGIQPFPISDNISNEMYDFFNYYGFVSNKIKEVKETFSIHTNLIELKITGRGIASKGLCGGVPANIVNLKINGNKFFDSLFMQECYGNDIYKIDINFKRRLVTLYTYDYGSKLFSFNLPFSYFKEGVSSLAEERIKYMPKEK